MKKLVFLFIVSTVLASKGQTLIVYPYPTNNFQINSATECGKKQYGYEGYANFPSWGYFPTNSGTLKASTADTNKIIVYLGAFGDTSCGKGSVTIPQPAPSPQYQFEVWFTNKASVITNYPLTLIGFHP